MTTTDKLTDRDWLISLLTIEQEQLLTDYKVHPDAWKGDPERTDGISALADGILESLARRASQASPASSDVLREAVPAGLVEALRSGRQADMDGVMVTVSRQACEMAADILATLSTTTEEPK